jgi:DNA repair exonuclease SbcCD nuclease subunit
MLQFIHAADIHLDSPLIGLCRYEGLPVEQIRLATRDAFDNLIRLAIDRAVDLVLIAGDLYDGDWRDAGTGMFFASRMSRLREHGIRVFLVRGNHDAASQITRSLHLPENVHVFEGKTASTIRLDELNVAVHGRSYVSQHVHSNLAAGYPAAAPGFFNIGLLHTSVGGFADHEPYAPCSLDDLRGKEYDYWALGHVHTTATLSEDPYIVFPGNIQGRSIRETGPKGCYLVTVDDSRRVSACEFMPLDTFRWRGLAIDLTGVADSREFDDRVAAALRTVSQPTERMLLLRVALTGVTPMHRYLVDQFDWKDDLRARAMDLGQERVWIEKIVLQTSIPSGMPPPMVPLPETAVTLEVFQAFLQKLPDEIRQEVSGWLDPTQPRYRQLMDEAKAVLAERLSVPDGSHAN